MGVARFRSRRFSEDDGVTGSDDSMASLLRGNGLNGKSVVLEGIFEYGALAKGEIMDALALGERSPILTGHECILRVVMEGVTTLS
jgi:hypothetical protein